MKKAPPRMFTAKFWVQSPKVIRQLRAAQKDLDKDKLLEDALIYAHRLKQNQNNT